ncbi:MAG: response regulator [Candidatus Odinarchaeota archaeon]
MQPHKGIKYQKVKTKGSIFIKDIRALHIDDEPDFLDLTRLFMDEINSEKATERPINIDSVSDPGEVVKKLAGTDYDVIISDYEMPEINGLQLLDTLRKQEKLDIPFIIFTGKGREDVAIRALNSGADYYLRKAENLADIFKELAMVINSLAAHKRTKAALSMSMKYYRLLYEKTPAVAVILGVEGQVIESNMSFRRLLGYTDVELAGKPFIDLVAEEERNWVKEQLELGLKDGSTPDKMFTLVTKTGSRIEVLFAGGQVSVASPTLITGVPVNYYPVHEHVLFSRKSP